VKSRRAVVPNVFMNICLRKKNALIVKGQGIMEDSELVLNAMV
jgi:hypothetical protein